MQNKDLKNFRATKQSNFSIIKFALSLAVMAVFSFMFVYAIFGMSGAL